MFQIEKKSDVKLTDTLHIPCHHCQNPQNIARSECHNNCVYLYISADSMKKKLCFENGFRSCSVMKAFKCDVTKIKQKIFS